MVSAGVVNVAPVAPLIGLVVSPELPWYHWNVEPVMSTAATRVAVWPLTIDELEGGWVKVGTSMYAT